MKVLKFGGTSVANAENINKVIEIVRSKIDNEQVVTVVSAFGGVTNSIIECGQLALSRDLKYELKVHELEARHIETAQELVQSAKIRDIIDEIKALAQELKEICHGIYLLNEISLKTKDYLLSFGERFSALIIAQAFVAKGIETLHVDARELIFTDENFGNANVDLDLTYFNIRDRLIGARKHIIVNGFIAMSAKKRVTTLGRGGSDFTAAIIAAAVNASILEIWTDVNGVMTADPNIVSSAYTLERLSYEEAMELSHFGAKVIYPPTLQPVLKKGIQVLIKNTFAPDENGTLISKEIDPSGRAVKGLSHIDDIALLTLTGGGMIGVSGIASRLFLTLSQNKINVIFITQASSEHTITIGINQGNVDHAVEVLNIEFSSEMKLNKIDAIQIDEKLSIVALVGDNMKESVGLSGKAFYALGSNGINVRAIAQGSTERNISIVIKKSDVKKALNVLHESFFLSELKRIHLFIIGVGNVGSKLLLQLNEQAEFLKKEFKIEIRVAGIANSRKMLFEENFIKLDNWEHSLMEKGQPSDAGQFIKIMKNMNLRNSVFIDNTASADIASLYASILQSSISVVASNKIAASSVYENYKLLNDLATRKNVRFLYETNVAAGLPVIKTIRDMIRSGDKIQRIEAVLSGSLNFIFNNFNAQNPFDEVVKRAMDEGYTEPDPRIDLSGIDVMRKILILARESGYHIEIEDIENEKFIPEEILSVEPKDAFVKALGDNRQFFEEIRKKAENESKRLRFTAVFDRGKASVGLLSVGKEAPYYQLEGKDNIVIIYSNRYREQPLIVKGAGAGAEVTASGVFADIMSIVNQ
ncbi:MAG: bifunctional aspartate kinase/homoserine dehydrogenase I [Bacteroidales bacterium]